MKNPWRIIIMKLWNKCEVSSTNLVDKLNELQRSGAKVEEVISCYREGAKTEAYRLDENKMPRYSSKTSLFTICIRQRIKINTMRILDNNKDFYDYCQNMYPDDLNTFDRRDSYNLSKEEFASRFKVDLQWLRRKFARKTVLDYQRIIVLQVCNTFWMFLLTITKTDEYGNCTDYSLVLLNRWQDYDVQREKLKLFKPDFNYSTVSFRDNLEDPKVIERMKQAIHTNDLKDIMVFNKFNIAKSTTVAKGCWNYETKTTPILKNIGIAALVDPLDIYLALDEYFSKEKTESERDASVGITDTEKAVNHGFDAKKSFRGKIK